MKTCEPYFILAYGPNEMVTQTHTILGLFLSPLFVSGIGLSLGLQRGEATVHALWELTVRKGGA